MVFIIRKRKTRPIVIIHKSFCNVPLIMISARNIAEHFSSLNYSTKGIHHHRHHRFVSQRFPQVNNLLLHFLLAIYSFHLCQIIKRLSEIIYVSIYVCSFISVHLTLPFYPYLILLKCSWLSINFS